MTLLLAWVVFPVVLAGIGAGLGVLVEWCSGASFGGALLVPVGLAAGIVVAGLLTTDGVTASFAAPAVAGLGLLGIARRLRTSLTRSAAGWAGPDWSGLLWPGLAAVGVLLVYGAPVLATGTATFTGFITLDDTATWLGITAHLFADGRSTAALAPSAYRLILDLNLGSGAYPVGSFMLLGVGAAVTGVDAAWLYQPYLACCGAALALCIYALCGPLVASRRLRCGIAFVAAQPALLYGYSLWGGIKELTAGFLVALISALVVDLVRERPAGGRRLVPLTLATAALIVTFGPGTAVWVGPALGVVVVAWGVAAGRRQAGWTGVLESIGWLFGGLAILALPVWIVLPASLQTASNFVGRVASASTAIRLGNLHGPLSGFEIAGIWPTGDFRDPLGVSLAAVVMIGTVVVAGLGAVWASVRARAVGLAVYAGLGLAGCAGIVVAGGVPWLVAKGLAVASPAVLLAGMVGAAMLWGRSKLAGALVAGLIVFGVVWSNFLGYRDATIAPVGPLNDLAQIGKLVGGRGPTLVNDDTPYADRYFLRAGDPVEPADLRSVVLPLLSGTILGNPSLADLDSFALETVLPFRSIVTRRSPAESRPPSIYSLVWGGRYYELWERAAAPTHKILVHVPYGDSTTIPYCGRAEGAGSGAAGVRRVCSMQPTGTPTCRAIRRLGAYAASHRAVLVAAERSLNVYVRGDGVARPAAWYRDSSGHSIAPNRPGRASVGVTLTRPESYELWLGGSFGRGFEVEVDGRRVGRVSNELSILNAFDSIAEVSFGAGSHTITLIYPKASLAPGSGDKLLSVLTGLVLAPVPGVSGQLTSLSPRDATQLCGKSVDWIEVVAPLKP